MQFSLRGIDLDLPLWWDLLPVILSWVPPGKLFQFRVVPKDFYKLILNTMHVNKEVNDPMERLFERVILNEYSCKTMERIRSYIHDLDPTQYENKEQKERRREVEMLDRNLKILHPHIPGVLSLHIQKRRMEIKRKEEERMEKLLTLEHEKIKIVTHGICDLFISYKNYVKHLKYPMFLETPDLSDEQLELLGTEMPQFNKMLRDLLNREYTLSVKEPICMGFGITPYLVFERTCKRCYRQKDIYLWMAHISLYCNTLYRKLLDYNGPLRFPMDFSRLIINNRKDAKECTNAINYIKMAFY